MNINILDYFLGAQYIIRLFGLNFLFFYFQAKFNEVLLFDPDFVIGSSIICKKRQYNFNSKANVSYKLKNPPILLSFKAVQCIVIFDMQVCVRLCTLTCPATPRKGLRSSRPGVKSCTYSPEVINYNIVYSVQVHIIVFNKKEWFSRVLHTIHR